MILRWLKRHWIDAIILLAVYIVAPYVAIAIGLAMFWSWATSTRKPSGD